MYTREELEKIGLDEAQIRAVLKQSAEEGVPAPVAKPAAVVPIHTAETVTPVNCDEAMAITTVTDLQSYAKGTVVRFPDFAEGQPFVARVRRPSMLVLAKQGKIPNSLLTAAGELFSKGGSGLDADNDKMLADAHDITEVICSAALIEPTLDDIYNAGMELSDDQLMAIFNYTQTGVRALESFRKE